MDETNHVICFSKGHSSALVAIEVSRRFGTDRLVLLNHDINPTKEHEDIKRFGREVSEYIGVPITYANAYGIVSPELIPDQFDVCVDAGAFQVFAGGIPSAICTSRLKTRPFQAWLAANHPAKDCIVYYGFDEDEAHRIARRRGIMDAMGYRSAYPLAEWETTIHSTSEVGIAPPLTYDVFNHANCVGCLKAKKQHWYVVYCTRPDIWAKAKATEIIIGHTIQPGESLESLEPKFAAMKCAGVEATEKTPPAKFWAQANRFIEVDSRPLFADLPCECSN